MAGFYVHIPFCKKRCKYCDFFSTTLLQRRGEYVDALLKEIENRKHEVTGPIRTIYLGGGTPSQLDTIDIFRILRTIGIDQVTEITVEVNPGDVTEQYLSELRQCGVNRLSIGVQSFQNDLLRTIGRRHTGSEAIDAVRLAQKVGFDNLSIDLMYALPGQTFGQWKADVLLALNLTVQHISAYGLMYEEGTVLTRMRDEGKITPVEEKTENAMYNYLCNRLEAIGYHHYEVSNFALPGLEAQHNSSYWDGTPYIGVGAGAHSYDGRVRSWNPDDLDAYIQGIQTGTLVRESETLSDTDRYNERIMLGLRTDKGVALTDIRADVSRFVEDKLLRISDDGRVVATRKGIHILNRIIEDVMV